MSDAPQNLRTRLAGGLNAVVLGAAAVVIVVLANALVSNLHWRVDLTDNRLYTLSPVTERSLQQLEEPVEVRAFISPDLPAPYHRLQQQIEETLIEYRAASNGRLNFEIISPDDPDEVRDLAMGYGIQPVTIGHRTDTEQRMRTAYLGVAFVQGARQETVGDLRIGDPRRMDNYEYQFTRAILNLQRERPRRIGIVTGDRPGDVEAIGHLFEQAHGRLMEVEAVDPKEAIDSSFDAVVFVELDDPLGREALRRIDAFQQGGGSVGWFQSGMVADGDRRLEELEQYRSDGTDLLPAVPRRQTDTDLVDYFAALGLKHRRDLVVDRQHAIAHGAVPTHQGPIRVAHPALFPIADIDDRSPFARHFSMFVLPAPSSIGIDSHRIPDDVAVRELFRTSEESKRLSDPPSRFLYELLTEPSSGERSGPHVVAATLEGSLPSVFEDERSPEDTRVVVVGSGELLGEVPEVGYGGELTGLGTHFFVNAVEWLATEDDLADIRGKSMPALLAEVPDDVQRSIKIINVALVPALFASVGFLMWVRRRRTRERIDEQFASHDSDEE